jgi:hypothetical protein
VGSLYQAINTDQDNSSTACSHTSKNKSILANKQVKLYKKTGYNCDNNTQLYTNNKNIQEREVVSRKTLRKTQDRGIMIHDGSWSLRIIVSG